MITIKTIIINLHFPHFSNHKLIPFFWVAWMAISHVRVLCLVHMRVLMAQRKVKYTKIIHVPRPTQTGWRKPIACLKLQVIFRKRATIYRALRRKITYIDKASYDSTPPCARVVTYEYIWMHISIMGGLTIWRVSVLLGLFWKSHSQLSLVLRSPPCLSLARARARARSLSVSTTCSHLVLITLTIVSSPAKGQTTQTAPLNVWS